jgi:hypothetical protein
MDALNSFKDAKSLTLYFRSYRDNTSRMLERLIKILENYQMENAYDCLEFVKKEQ